MNPDNAASAPDTVVAAPDRHGLLAEGQPTLRTVHDIDIDSVIKDLQARGLAMHPSPKLEEAYSKLLKGFKKPPRS